MKHLHLAGAIVCFLISMQSISLSQDRGFGAGILIGEPTGISLKGWLSATTALDAGLAWSFHRETALHVHADYLIHDFGVFHTRERIPIYYGIGGRIKTARHEDASLGLRVVVGADYMFRDAPVDIFLEVAPVLDLAPATDLEGNAGLGVRFWFR